MSLFFLCSGILAVGGFIIVSYLNQEFQPFWAAISAGAFIQGLFLYALTGAAADALRILKKQNNLSYGGEISKVNPISSYQCSKCKGDVFEFQKECSGCNAVFK